MPASAVAAVAAGAGVAIALLWLLTVGLLGPARRLRLVGEVCLAAPFALVLERPG